MTQSFPINPQANCPVPGCTLTGPVFAHGAAIADLTVSSQRVETKLDRLIWGITTAAVSSVVALIALVFDLMSRRMGG